MKIVHISDLHLSGLNFIPEWGEKVIDLVNSMNSELLVVTGDLTDDGYIHEYDIAKRYFDYPVIMMQETKVTSFLKKSLKRGFLIMRTMKS